MDSPRNTTTGQRHNQESLEGETYKGRLLSFRASLYSKAGYTRKEDINTKEPPQDKATLAASESGTGLEVMLRVAMYDAALTTLKQELATADHVYLTGNGWTSRVADHYMTITVHYLKDWQLQCKVLQTPKGEVRQTGENITVEIDYCLEDFKLEGKVRAMTTDNARAMINATSMSGTGISLGCFTHNLNLETQKMLSARGVPALLGIIRSQYPAVVSVTLDDRIKKDEFKKLASDSDMGKMETFLQVAGLLYKMTTAMSSEQKPTAALCHNRSAWRQMSYTAVSTFESERVAAVEAKRMARKERQRQQKD
ncbi:hypothetical protein Bbelb_035440 [Branchiostoma belcheri]|nr:hypothetical protein Bbelb_035440 [Branchiostoma belcheri]